MIAARPVAEERGSSPLARSPSCQHSPMRHSPRRRGLRLQPRAVPADRRGRADARHARSARATPAAEVSEGVGLSVSVRKGEVENVERNRDKSIGITVYIGQRRGNASTLRLLARRARADGARGLRHRPLHRRGPGRRPARCGGPGARRGRAARPRPVPPVGDRRRRGAPSSRRRCEAAAFAVDQRITNSEGAGVSAQQSHFYAGNSRGFRGGYAELAPFAVGRADRRPAGAAATCSATPGTRRCATPDDAGRARGGRPLRRRARAVAPEVAQDRDLRGAGAVRVDARGRPARRVSCRRRAAARCTASRASCSTASASRCCRRTSTSTRTRTSARGKGSAPFDDEGVRDAAARRRPRRRGAGLLPLDLFGAQARACDRPATPAARRT